MDDKTKSFCKRYRARVEQSPYRVNKIKSNGITFSDREAVADPALDIEYEQMVAIHLPRNRASALVEHDEWLKKAEKVYDNNHYNNNICRVSNLILEHERECRIRHENPAVKDAYEKYLALLNLVGSAYDDGTW